MKLKAIVLLSTLVLSGAVLAQTKAPEPDYTLSYNLGGVTEYRYRGISQSGKKPALQGGIDFAHKSGFYLGTWGSTIRWIKDSSANGIEAKGPVEIDLYGGYKHAINDTFSFDVGGLQYWYTGNTLKNITGVNANTFELYGAVSAGPGTLKYSRSTTNLFGTPNSKGSGYLDLSATFDLGDGVSLVPHIGAQHIAHFGTYEDASLTLAKDWEGTVLSAAVVSTNWSHRFGAEYTLPGTGNKDLAGTNLVLGIKKNF
ncbi:MAG: TorF family putative porin [Ramlibacter sp.]